MNEQENSPEKNSKETKINDLPDEEFNETVTKILPKLESRIEELREHFNKYSIIKNQAELKNTITEIKNTLEGINRRLANIEELINDLEDRLV